MGICGSKQASAEKYKDSSAGSVASDEKRGSSSVQIARGSLVIINEGCLSDSYDLEKKLGEGAYGSVSQATCKGTGAIRAIKSIPKENCNVEGLKREIAIQKVLDHPNILKLYETFEDHRYIYMVMELCTGGELIERVQDESRFTEAQAANIVQQMLSAVFYMHNAMYCHRDIKPENFLLQSKDPLEEASVKLIDFGLSCKIEKGKMFTQRAGTPYYVSPQVLDRSYDASCDVWSCGVIMYELLCGNPPFDADKEEDLFSAIKEGKVSFQDATWQNVSDDAKNLILQLLTVDPAKRVSAEQALNHTWVKSKAPEAKDVSLGEDVLKRFKSFRSCPRLKKAALHIIASQLDESVIKDLRAMFAQLDSNGDGLLTSKELGEGLKKAGLLDAVSPTSGLQDILEGVDVDGSGEIDYTEFLAAALEKKQYLQEDACWSAFRVFDRNGDGKISKEELKSVLLNDDSIEVAMGEEAIAECMRDIDANGDGEIDFQEFMAMMKGKGGENEAALMRSKSNISQKPSANFERLTDKL